MEASVQSALRRLLGKESDPLKSFNDIRYTPFAFTIDAPDQIFDDAFLMGSGRLKR